MPKLIIFNFLYCICSTLRPKGTVAKTVGGKSSGAVSWLNDLSTLTHFSAKQQKRITTNENNIKLIENKVDINKQNIDDIKNNWFNIETSPLWKKMSSFIPSNEFGKIYLAIWGYIYQPPNNPTDNYIYSNKKTIFNLSGEIQRTTQKTIKLDELIVNDNVKIQLLFTKEWNDITVTSNDVNYQPSSVTLYQYQGKGTPTEFIAEESTEHDYYTKQETDNLLIKKQNINDDALQTVAKQIVPAINENKVNTDKKQDKLTAGTNITINENNVISATGGSSDLTDYYKKEETNTLLDKKQDKFTLIKEDTTYKVVQYKELGTGVFSGDLDIPPTKFIKQWINESVIEIKDLIKKLVVWKQIGERIDDRTWSNFTLSFNAIYRVFLITETSFPLQNGYKEVIFFTLANSIGTGTYRITSRKIGNSDAALNMIYDNTKWTLKLDGGDTGGAIYRLEELKADDLYEIKSNTLEIKSPEFVDIEKPIKIDSKTLLTKEIRENEWEINLKENPTPSPCACPKWKEVGIVGKNKWGNWEIKYDFKDNGRYRIYYNWGEFDYIKIMTEFIHMEAPTTNEIVSFNDGDTHMVLTMGFGKDLTIYSLKGKSKGKLFKLEELQE